MTAGSPRTSIVEQADLLAVVALAVVTAGVVVLGVQNSVLRATLAAPFVLFLPGYALAAALFPESAHPKSPSEADVPQTGSLGARLLDRSGLTPVERVALSVAASAALSAMVAFVEAFVVGIYVTPFVLGVAALTVATAAVGVARRRGLPASRRSSVHPRTRLRRTYARYFVVDRSMARSNVPFEATTRRDVLVNAALVVSVLAFVTGVGAAAMVPQQGPYTEFYTLSNGQGGNSTLVGSASVDSTNRTLVVANHEGHAVDYTVVLERQRVKNGKVVDSRDVSTTQKRVKANGTWSRPIDLSGVQGGDNVRVQFALYKGQPTGNPDLTLRLWYGGSGGSNADLRRVNG